MRKWWRSQWKRPPNERIVQEARHFGLSYDDVDSAYHRLGIGERTGREWMIARDLAETEEERDELLLRIALMLVATALERHEAWNMLTMPVDDLQDIVDEEGR